jgi:diguanylate cyclase (GGDEF)-like protein/PAS domain S-box-containing protein
MAAVLDAIGDAVAVMDAVGTITYWSPAAERLFGYSTAEAVGRPVLEIIVHDLVPEQAEAILSAMRAGQPWSGHQVCHRKNGTVLPIQLTDTPLLDEAGELVGIVRVARDVTDAELHRGIVEAAQEGIIKVQDRMITFSNPAASTILKLPPDALVGRPLADFFDAEQLQVIDDIRTRLLDGEYVRAELPVLAAGGERRWVAISATALHDDRRRYTGTVTLFTDITERRALEEMATFRAMHDELTGLVNRAVLSDRLEHGVAVRLGAGQHDLAVLFFDLDRFKDINDSYGHDAGDILLSLVAERIVGAVRPTDTVARFGGDEFVVICEGVTGPSEALAIAERVHDAFESPFEIEGHEVVVGGSIGLALMDGDICPQRLLADADAAMYHAKRSGGTRRISVFDDSLRRRATTRRQLRGDIRRALDAGEFSCHYQPIVDLTEAKVIGLEALVRWDHPERGLLAPDTFLDVAEDSGLVIPLGEQVLFEACRDVAKLGNRLRRRLHVAVNVSARQFADRTFVDRVAAAITDSGIAPCAVLLELTETTVMDDPEAARAMMAELKRQGVRFAIDDFGTGYSSLLYLKRLPIDEVKVDRSFVGGLGTSTHDSAIVASVVSMARAMNLTCVAEGVETFEHLAGLRQLGCDSAQGYLFSRPVPAADVPRVIAEVEREAAHWERRQRARRARPVQLAADTLRTVLAMHESGASMTTIAARLNADGVRTPAGSRWHPRTVARVVTEARFPHLQVQRVANSA